MKIQNYLFLDDDYNIVKTYTVQQIYQLYKIKNMDAYLLVHDRIDGYIVVEDEPCEHVCFYRNHKYSYYCNEKGEIFRQNNKTKKRIMLKGYINKNILYVKIDGRILSVAHIILNSFYKYLPKDYIVQYDDKNPSNCSLDNLEIYTRNEFIKGNQKIILNKKNVKKIGLFEDGKCIKTFQSVKETLEQLQITSRIFYKCIYKKDKDKEYLYDLRYL